MVDMPLQVSSSAEYTEMTSLEYVAEYKQKLAEISGEDRRPVLLYRVSWDTAPAAPTVPDYLLASLEIPTAIARPMTNSLTILSEKRSKRICQSIIFA
jgi:hypothetical protein